MKRIKGNLEMTRFAGPVYHAGEEESGVKNIKPYAGLPVGIEFEAQYDIFRPFNYFYGDELPGYASASDEPRGGAWTVTADGTGACTFPVSERRRRLRIATGSLDDENIQIQYAQNSLGADDYITNISGKNEFFSITLTLWDANNDDDTLDYTEFFVGFAAVDTSVFGGVTDFVGFWKPEHDTPTAANRGMVNLVAGKDTTGFSTATASIENAHQITDTGSGAPVARTRFDFVMTPTRESVLGWVDGNYVGKLEDTTGSLIPQNDDMTITVALGAREGLVKNMNVFNLLTAVEL